MNIPFKKVSDMTLKEKIGQLMIVGFHGYEYNENLDKLIKEYKVGNVILFTRNIDNIKQLHDLNMRIHQEIIASTGVIPFISIDQEGGIVTRIMKEATFFPGNMTLTACGDAKNAYLDGAYMGKELRALGINMNLAPSLDVNNNPINPVIGVRSYSDNPEVVARYGEGYIRGLQDQGVVATAKHFPGHGDTSSDSHKSLPVIPHNKERLHAVELLPFKKVLNTTKAIMSAHVFFEAYESGGTPGTLSRKVITDLLRNELGYKGLIVSDCMEMKAIDATYTASRGAVLGLKAGLDQAMVTATYEKQLLALQLIEKAVEDGELLETEIDEKVERILSLKAETQPIMEEFFYNASYEEKEAVLLDKEAKEFTTKVVDSSLTLVKGKDIETGLKTLVIATEPFAMTIAEDELSARSIASAIKERQINVDVEKIDIKLEDNRINELVKKSLGYQQVVVCTYNALAFKNQANLIKELNKQVSNLFVISTRSPYDLFAFPQVKNYLCLYEYTPASVITIAKYLEGKIKPLGKLPVLLKEKVSVGASLYVGLDDYSLEDNLAYLEKLAKNKVDKVFISAHMPEMKETFVNELKVICDKAQELGVKIILDVAKPMMNKINFDNVFALRLDYGFTKDEIIALTKELAEKGIKVELNASTITKSDLQYFSQAGLDVSKFRISHNFYPKMYTGLSRDAVLEKNAIYKEFGMKVMMYIPASGKRPPLYDGLPTVEEHRYLPLEAILAEIRALEIDEVFFGDAYATDEEINTLVNYNYDEILIPVVVYKNVSETERQLLVANHRNRLDKSEYFVRSSVRSDGIKQQNAVDRNVKDVTIDNELFKRYQGEVCIMMKGLPKDERVNVVGKALCSEFLLNKINGGMKFKLKIVGEIDE